MQGFPLLLLAGYSLMLKILLKLHFSIRKICGDGHKYIISLTSGNRDILPVKMRPYSPPRKFHLKPQVRFLHTLV